MADSFSQLQALSPSSIKWSHSTNSCEAIDTAWAQQVQFFEADILFLKYVTVSFFLVLVKSFQVWDVLIQHFMILFDWYLNNQFHCFDFLWLLDVFKFSEQPEFTTQNTFRNCVYWFLRSAKLTLRRSVLWAPLWVTITAPSCICRSINFESNRLRPGCNTHSDIFDAMAVWQVRHVVDFSSKILWRILHATYFCDDSFDVHLRLLVYFNQFFCFRGIMFQVWSWTSRTRA